jgi:hypothetical protein
MQNKIIKYFLSILLLLFVVYNSVYFKKLDEVKAAYTLESFEASSYANNFYHNKLLPHHEAAIEISKLISLLKTEPAKTFKKYSHALGIGNIRYFLVQGEGIITSIGEDAVTLSLGNDLVKTECIIATEFVYGNAIRDASGLMNLNDFSNPSDFNRVSEEINKIVRREVVPPFKAKVKQENVVKFIGAIELNQAHLILDSIEIIPIQLSILK